MFYPHPQSHKSVSMISQNTCKQFFFLTKLILKHYDSPLTNSQNTQHLLDTLSIIPYISLSAKYYLHANFDSFLGYYHPPPFHFSSTQFRSCQPTLPFAITDGRAFPEILTFHQTSHHLLPDRLTLITK